MPGFTLYENAYRQGLDDAIRAQMMQLFNVLMSEWLDGDAVKRFIAGIERTVQAEAIVKDVIRQHVENPKVKQGV